MATLVEEGDQSGLRMVEARVPRVSIGMPVYNEERFIRAALDSLLAQTFQDFELIISDNASSDATFRIAQEYAGRDPRIVVHRNERNLGAVANFGRVLALARAPYFMWAAADDRWARDFISALFDELECHPEAGVAMTAVERLSDDGGTMDTVRFRGRDDPNRRGYYAMLKGLCSNRKYNLYLYGLFRTGFLNRAMPLFPDTLGGDRLFLCQIAAGARLRYVDRVLHFRTRQLHHERSYAAANRRRGVHRRQLLDLARLLGRSPVIPWHRKVLLIPPTLVRYSLWTLGKAYGTKTTWRLLSRYLDSDGVIVKMTGRTKAGLLLALLVATAVLAAASSWGGALGVLVVGLGLCVLAALAVIARMLWGLRTKLLSLLQESKESNARLESLLAERTRHVEESVSTTVESSLAQRIKHVEKYVGTTVGLAAKRTVAQLMPLFREIRYLTDLQVEAGPEPPVLKGNPLSRYARERYEKHRKTVVFARNFEDSRIRELYLSEIFPGIEQVAIPLGAINELSGHANKVDMLFVCAIARHLKARRIFEFGTYQGRTSYHLTYASDGAQVTTLNLPPAADPRYAPYLGSYFRGTEREAFITQVLADSRQFDTEPHRHQFDLVFVDGDHSYDFVKNDTEKAFELLKPGGAILWHDYAPKSEGLVEFFRDFTQERPLFRIKRTCVLLHLDGVDPLGFVAHPLPPSLEQDSIDDEVCLIEELYHP